MLPLEVLDIPGEIKVGYSPIGFVRCGRAACRVSKVLWKIGKETGGKKMEEPHSLKSNEMAEVHAGLGRDPCFDFDSKGWYSKKKMTLHEFFFGNIRSACGLWLISDS